MATFRAHQGWEALGDPSRFAIMQSLAESPRSVGDLAAGLPISRQAVSQHLRVLKDAGLVANQAIGTRRVYRLNPAGVAAMRDQLDTFWRRALDGYHQVIEDDAEEKSMTQAGAAVVRRENVVNAAIDKVFTVFTDRFGDFKPPEHNMLRVPIAETVFEPKVGGHIYDRGTDGSECRWARILAYDPPHRVVFSWDIGPTWQVESDPDNASEVEVTFTAETPSAPGSSWNIATSIGTARAGSRSGTAWATTRAGRSTSTATPPC